MIDFEFEIIKDDSAILAFGDSKSLKKKVNILYRQGLKKGLENWHKKHVSDHFKKKAFNKYPEYDQHYPTQKKRKYRPLHITGTLERNIKSRITFQAKHGGGIVVGKMPVGRPGILPQDQDEILRALIVTEMEKTNRTYKEADAYVGRKQSYSKESHKRFQDIIPAMTDNEAQEVADFVLKFIVEGITEARNKRRKKKVK